MRLKDAVINMLIAYNGFDATWHGRTAAQHAQAAWTAAKQRAVQAGRADAALAAIALEDRIAVALFTRRAHAALNQALAAGNPLSAHEATYLRCLLSGLHQLPLEPQTATYRGMHIRDATALKNFLQAHRAGTTFTLDRLWSASASPMVAFSGAGFGGNIEISFEGSVTARPLGALSGNASHQESLFPHGARFKVLQSLRMPADPTRTEHPEEHYRLHLRDLGEVPGQVLVPPCRPRAPC